MGCVSPFRAAAFRAKRKVIERARAEAQSLSLTAREATRAGFHVSADGQRRSLSQLLAHHDITFEALCAIWPQIGAWPGFAREQVEIDAAYSGYLDRQDADVAVFRRDEALSLPANLDYRSLGGLSNEVREKLIAAQPATLGQAARIEGVTPGALTALLSHVRRCVA